MSNFNYPRKPVEDPISKRINKFQDAKERGIALMSANRDATLIVTSIGAGKFSEEELKAEIKKWRNWFFYEVYQLDPDDEVKQKAKEKVGNTTHILGF